MSRLVIVIPGNPGDGRINAAYKPAVITVGRGKSKKTHATLLKTTLGKAFEQRVIRAGREAKRADPVAADAIHSASLLCIKITAYWDRCRRLPGTDDLPIGDWDAPVKAIGDPLQDWYGKGKHKKRGAGLYDDDVRFMEAVVVKAYDPANPRIEVEVYPLDDGDKDDG